MCVPFFFDNVLVGGSSFPRCSPPCLLPHGCWFAPFGVCLSGSGLFLGGLFGPPCSLFLLPVFWSQPCGPSCGVWPFLGGLAALPACPTTEMRSFLLVPSSFELFILVLTMVFGYISWVALRPSLLARQLSRGLLLLLSRLSGLSFCFNYGWLYLGGLIITGLKYVILQSASLAEFFEPIDRYARIVAAVVT